MVAMNKKVIIVGAFHEIIELAEEMGVEIVGLIDNEKENYYRNYAVLCNDDNAINLPEDLKRIPLIITPSLPTVRLKLYLYYERLDFSFSSLISINSNISNSADIGIGTIIQPGVNVSANTQIGKFVKLNTNCNITHDCIVGDFTTVAPNAVVLGYVKIGKSCYIGANSTILPNIEICDNTFIGAGAVVTRNVSTPATLMGMPARVMKK